MFWRGSLLIFIPAAALGFAPTLTSGPAGHAPVRFRSRARYGAACDGAPAGTRVRSRTTHVERTARMTVSASLVEQPVTTNEAVDLIGRAKRIVEGDMGVKVPDMLAGDFRFLWQFNGVMSRADYLTEGKGPYTTLRTALPDLFWNSYDFRVDKYEKNRVWATTRLRGTHNGPLVFDGKEYPASGSKVEAAPECVSLMFDDESGLCNKMTGGFCLDRGAGNTGPAGGIWGVLQAIGQPVSAWKYYPPVKVVADIVGPTFRPKKSPGSASLPYREPIAIALAKQVLGALRDDVDSLPGLLADDLQAYAPILGPLKKKELVKSTKDVASFFSGLDVTDNFYDGRVDPFEPRRVWLTLRPVYKVAGPLECFGVKFEPKKESFDAGPATFSVTFDKDGFASKITLGCPMDTEIGDTDGLTNFQGILAGLGIPAPDIFGRPAPESFRRFVESITPEGMKSKPKPKPKPKPKASPTLATGSVASAASKSRSPASAKKSASTAPAKAKPPTPRPAPKMAAKPSPPPKTASSTFGKTGSKPATKAASATSSAEKGANASPADRTDKAAGRTGGLPSFGSMMPKSSPAKTSTPAAASRKGPAAKASQTRAPKASPKPATETTKRTTLKPGSKTTGKAAAYGAAAPSSKAAGSSAKKQETTRSAGDNAQKSTSFRGLFNFGPAKGGGKSAVSGTDAASSVPKQKLGRDGVTPKSSKEAAKSASPAPVPAKVKRAAAPAPAPAPAAAKASTGVSFSPQLAQALQAALGGSSQRLDQLTKRTELYARGGISANDYWGTLKSLLGPDGAQNLAPDIIGALPVGNQKRALLKIYSTG